MLAVVQGREVDRVPFVQYDGAAGPTDEIWSLVGRDNMGILRWTSAHRIEHPNCRFETAEEWRGGLRGTRTWLHTPAGSLTALVTYQPDLGAAAHREHYVKTVADYGPLMAFLRDAVITAEPQRVAAEDAAVGDDGLLHCAVERTPFQQLWIQWVSIEDLCLHLADEPDAVMECMALMAGNLRKQFEAAARAPVPYVVFPDNITAPVIGVRYFLEHCVPFYNELADMLAERGIPVFVHMDGDLKPLWQAISQSRVRGIDSLSPPPDNDTSVGEALRLWPEMRILVNFPSSVHLAPEDRVYSEAARILEEGGRSGRLQIQISENVPPGAWRRSIPAIVRAIRDFAA